jgi:hypothetical protein
MPNNHSPQAKPQAKPKQVRHSDFSELYVGRLVMITLANGMVIKGVVAESRRYWMQVMVDGKAHYINKAYIIDIVPS